MEYEKPQRSAYLMSSFELERSRQSIVELGHELEHLELGHGLMELGQFGVGIVGLVALVARVGFVGLVGLVALVGRVGLVGLVARVGRVGLVGLEYRILHVELGLASIQHLVLGQLVYRKLGLLGQRLELEYR